MRGICYTATYTDTQDEEFTLSLGAARFIVKPSEPDKFLALLQEVSELHRAGKLPTRLAPQEDDAVFYNEYNQVLVSKLESKVLELREESLKAQKSERFLRDVLQTAPQRFLPRVVTCRILR
ncbi:MAG: hypothetical protein WA133_08110 [Syntrophales bacterium]